MGSRGSFGSRFGVIAAVSGSVIGLGNIWRFPYVAGENGGAAFILIYIACSFLISIPLMLSEFSLGRSSKRNTKRAFQKLAPGTRWNYVGYMGIFCAFILLSFYCVIAGWALEFIKESVLNEFAGKSAAQISENFNGFIASGWRPGGVDGRFHAVNGLHRLVRNRKRNRTLYQDFHAGLYRPGSPRWPSTP